MALPFLAQSTDTGCTLNGEPIACGELYDKAEPFIGLGVGLIILFVVLAIISFVFWIVMLVHAANHNSPDRTLWLIILIASFFFGFSFIAAIAYFFVEKKKAEVASNTPLTSPRAGTGPQYPPQPPTGN